MPPLFDLQFESLESILATVEDCQSTLGWLDISSGSFRLNINGQALFDYHPKRVQAWLSDLEYCCYLRLSGLQAQDVDYSISSFYLALQDTLPFLSDSVPKLAHDLYLCSMEAQQDYLNLWEEREDTLAQQIGVEAASEQSSCGFRYFYENSFTDFGISIPETHAWRYGDDVYIRINSMASTENGEPCFAYPQHCVYRLPYRRFINEYRQFAQRYLDGMKRGIKALRPLLPSPAENPYGNFESFMASHQHFQNELEAKLTAIHPQSWDEVWQANQAAGIDLAVVVEKWQNHRLPIIDVQ